MKYIIRALKSFVSFVVILTLMLLLLKLFNIVGNKGEGIEDLFRDGWQSIAMCLGIVGLYSFGRPFLSYGERQLLARGSYEEVRPGVMEVMENHGYKLESENGEDLTFVKRSPMARLMRVWEDRLTFKRTMNGFVVEGLIKDSVRVISAIEYRYRGE